MADPNSPSFSLAGFLSLLLDRAGNSVTSYVSPGKIHLFHRQDFKPVEDKLPTVIRPGYVLSSAEDLGRWLLARADGRVRPDSTDVLVEAKPAAAGLTVSATFNPWGHGGGSIKAEVKRTPAFNAWASAINGAEITVDAFATLLREHGDFLGRATIKLDGKQVDGGAHSVALLEKLQALDVTVMSKGSSKRDASGRVTLSCSTAEADLGPVTFDPTYPVQTKLFEGVDGLVFSRIFLYPRVVTKDGTPELRFRITWPDLQVHVDAAVAKQVEQLRAQLGDGWEVNAGTGGTLESTVPYGYPGIARFPPPAAPPAPATPDDV